jgi:hypothetical protein
LTVGSQFTPIDGERSAAAQAMPPRSFIGPSFQG